MVARYVLAAALLALAAFALWHPARSPLAATTAVTAPPIPFPVAPDASRPLQRRGRRAHAADDQLVVYVAGAVKRPGLYHLHPGDRDAQAVAMAGGFSPTAQTGGVNLAQRADDGDEIYVPVVGESPGRRRSAGQHTRHPRAHRTPPGESVDVNYADAAQLATVPGIGRAIAARIVELRAREGNFASLDELLDVAGMTASRLERARPYLREP